MSPAVRCAADPPQPRLTRREALLLGAASGALTLGAPLGLGAASGGAQPAERPLEAILVQALPQPIDPLAAGRDLERNVARLIATLASVRSELDLSEQPSERVWVAFPTEALTGWHSWNAGDLARIAIETDGEALHALTAAAFDHRFELSLGALVRDPRAAEGFSEQRLLISAGGGLRLQAPQWLCTAEGSRFAVLGCGNSSMRAQLGCASASPPPGVPAPLLEASASRLLDAQGRVIARALDTSPQLVRARIRPL